MIHAVISASINDLFVCEGLAGVIFAKNQVTLDSSQIHCTLHSSISKGPSYSGTKLTNFV